MTDPVRTAPPAGWYPDPQGLPQQRWWTGVQWSHETSPAPQQSVAPVAAEPAPVTYTPTFLPTHTPSATQQQYPFTPANPIAQADPFAQPGAFAQAAPFAQSAAFPQAAAPAVSPVAPVPAPAPAPAAAQFALPATPTPADAFPTRRQLRERAQALAAEEAQAPHDLAPFAMPAADAVPAAPVELAPVQQTPVQQTPVQQTPVQQTPGEQTPAPQTPARAIPAQPSAILPSPPMSASDLFPERYATAEAVAAAPTPQPTPTVESLFGQPVAAAPAVDSPFGGATPSSSPFGASSYGSSPFGTSALEAAATPAPVDAPSAASVPAGATGPNIADILAGRPVEFSTTVASLTPRAQPAAAPQLELEAAETPSSWPFSTPGGDSVPYEPFGMIPKVTDGTATPAETVYTGSAWVIAAIPALMTAAYVAVYTFIPDSYTRVMQIGIAAVFALITLVLAQRDQRSLQASGHREPASFAWVLLTPLVYFIVRGLRVRRETGRMGILLAVWLLLVVAIGAAAYLLAPAGMVSLLLGPATLGF